MMAVSFMHYNFMCIHQVLRVIRAMAAGVSKFLWSMADVVAMIEHREGQEE
jgi:hypothetical protein